MPLSVRGPKGGPITHSISPADLAKKLPGLIRKYKKVTVAAADKEPPNVAPEKPTVAEIRQAIVEFCWQSIKHEKDWHYAQARPMERLRTPEQLSELPREADCSEHATDAYASAGGPDPNGQNFDGTGYTGTMLEHCRHIDIHAAQPGDLAVFGAYPGHHVVVLLEDGVSNGGNPLVCSHGQEKGPIAIRLLDEAHYQPVPITFLTCLD